MDAKDILETDIYPRLSHELIFRNLSGLKNTRTGIEADCPRCGHKGTFYATQGTRYGACNRRNNCGYKVGWWSHVMESHGLSKQQTLYYLAELAGVEVKRTARRSLNSHDLNEVREMIAQYGRRNLLGGDPGAVKIRSYLLERGFTLDELKGTDPILFGMDIAKGAKPANRPTQDDFVLLCFYADNSKAVSGSCNRWGL